MERITVNLVNEAMSSLGEAAASVEETREVVFKDVVRYALRAYHVVEFSGFLRLIDDKWGTFKEIHFRADTPPPSLRTRILAKILGVKEQKPPAFQRFEALLRESTAEEVRQLASLYGLSQTDLYNRLVIVGSKMVCHDIGGIYGFTRAGEPLGEIEFPLEK